MAPVLDGKGGASYPHDHGGELMDLYQKGGVNAVSFGHSHVYERYFTKDAHYIEAAYMSICFRREGALPHPSGLLPIVENNSARSFIIVERNENGLSATGYFAETGGNIRPLSNCRRKRKNRTAAKINNTSYFS